MSHTLLLADDSVTVHRVIELTFAGQEVKVVAVSDGEAAIARLEAAPPDIVLADIGMPGKNGYEVAQYIKQSPRLSHIPVVLLTGVFEPVDQSRAAAAGCDGVLAKPFEPHLVISRVKALLAQPKGSAPDAAPAPPFEPPPFDPPPAEPSSTDISNYFDRLDAAFATLRPPSPSGPALVDASAAVNAAMAASPEAVIPLSTTVSSVAGPIDWFAAPAPAAGQRPDLPVSYASPESAFEASAEAASPDRLSREPDRQAPVAPAPLQPVVLPPLADAFAALLAAEQADTAATPLTWPSATPSLDAFVDQISSRVLDQIAIRTDGVVRAAVADLVSQLAERLIREEIERIKASIE